MDSYNVAWLLAAANAARLWPLLHMHLAWEVLLVSNSNDNPDAPYAHCPRAFCKDLWLARVPARRSCPKMMCHRSCKPGAQLLGDTGTYKQYNCSPPVHRLQCCSIVNNSPATENTLEVFYVVLIVYTVRWVPADTTVQ